MSIKTKIASFVVKHLGLDQDHGGWFDSSWSMNYWQQGLSTTSGVNNVVYSCVQAYAQTIAQLPGNHMRSLSNGGTETVRNSAAHRVMRKPNNYQTRSDFLLNLVYALLYEGNAYALAVRNSRFEVESLHLVPPRACSPVVLDGEVYYQISPDSITGETASLVAPARDVLHVRLHTPHDPLRGETPLYAAAMAVSTNNAIMGHQAAFFNNMSRPSGIITSDEKLTAEQTADLRARWDEMSKGLNSGKVPILSWGLKWQSLSLSSADAQLIEALKFSVKDIARAYRVPMSIIGEDDGATYNNTYHLLAFWKATGLGFVLEHIEQALTALFRMPDGEKIELDTDSLLRTDTKARVEAITQGITGGLYSPNEGRRMEGLPSVSGGDMPRVQQQMVPLDFEPPEPALPMPPPPDPEAEEKRVRDMKTKLLQVCHD